MKPRYTQVQLNSLPKWARDVILATVNGLDGGQLDVNISCQECVRLTTENGKLRELVDHLSERCLKQSELLSKRAEKKLGEQP